MAQITTFDLLAGKVPAADIPTYKPIREEEKYIRDSFAWLVVKAPFFAHLLYNEMKVAYTRAPEIPYAATDGHTIFFNPGAMAQDGFNLKNVAFIAAHEVAHGFLSDLILNVKFLQDGFVTCPSGRQPFSHELMNIAEDYRINAMLIEAKVGEMPTINGKMVGVYDRTISEKGMESAIEIYDNLLTSGKAKIVGTKVVLGGLSQGGKNGQGVDVHLQPTPAKIRDADTGKAQQAIVAAAEAANASGQGTLPAAVQRLLGDILEPKVAWEDNLRSTIMRASGDPCFDWRRLDKRLLVRPNQIIFAAPGFHGAGTVVIADDTSGSIDDDMLQRFFAEMNGILRDLSPQRVIIMWCDAAVHRVDELEEVEDLLEYKEVLEADGGPGGGGGTNFGPVFDKVQEMDIQPDLLVYLTDTYGRFPAEEPDYPVVWATIGGTNVPWGKVVEVEL